MATNEPPVRMTENDKRRAAAIAAGVYIKTYPNTKEFQRHAAQLAIDNWTVTSVVERKPNAGCLRIALLWWLTLLFPPRPELVVTYAYNDPNKVVEEVPTPFSLAAEQLSVTQRACFNCGAIIAISHKFCPNCGAALGPRNTVESQATVGETPIDNEAGHEPTLD